MFEPVTITSNVVATGSPLACGVGVISCACVIITKRKATAMIARPKPTTGGFLAAQVVATALCRRAATRNNAGAPRHSEAATTSMTRRLAHFENLQLLLGVGCAGDTPATTDSLECLGLSLEAQGRIWGRGRLVVGRKER